MKTAHARFHYALCFLIIWMTACTSISPSESGFLEDRDYTYSLLLEKSTAPITAEQAINVVKLFDIKNHIET